MTKEYYVKITFFCKNKNKWGRKEENKKNKIEKIRDPYGLLWNYFKLRTHFRNAVHKKDFISFQIFFLYFI